MSTDTTSDQDSEPNDSDSDKSAVPVSVDAPIFPVGRVLSGKYTIEGILGRGGMGVVHAARQHELDRPVAIKILRQTPGHAARAAQRFAREARAIAKMRSEHCVRVYDVGVEEGLPFIVMERLMGNDLAAELTRRRPTAETTVVYMLQACEAIAEAHSLGIVHRDLKPSNLFIAETVAGRRILKVLDFGVSKWLTPAPDFETPMATGTHSFIGTPAYVSPEQLTQPDAVDVRADVWALGAVLYQCLCGKVPFTADSVPRLCAEILTAEPRPMTMPEGAPEGLRDIVRRCLKKNPKERYQNVGELARALSAFAPAGARPSLEWVERLSMGLTPTENEVSHGTLTAQAVTPAQQSTTAGFSQETRVTNAGPPERAPKRSRGRRAMYGLFVGASAIGIAVAAVRAQRGGTAPPEHSAEASQTQNGQGPATREASLHAAPAPARAPEPLPVAVSPSPPAPQAPLPTQAAPATATAKPLAVNERPKPVAKPRAPTPKNPPATTAAAPSAAPPASHAPAPTPPPSADVRPAQPSDGDFDRHIYRR